MRSPRSCSRNGCPAVAVATLTYIYADSTAVIGPLAGHREPHTYDLCEAHARSLTAPRGWQVVRYDGELTAPPDDLDKIAEAVRERRGPGDLDPSLAGAAGDGRRDHLRVVPPA